MARATRRLLLMMLLLVGPTASHADPEPGGPDFARIGAYARLGFEIGAPHITSIGDLNREMAAGTGPPPAPGTTMLDREYAPSNFGGVALAIGYRFHRRFALEGALTWTGGELYADVVDGTVPSDPVLVSELRSDLSHLWVGMCGKAYLTTGRVQPFALIGFGMQRDDGVVRGGLTKVLSGAGGRFGGGLDIYLTRSLALDATLTYDLGMGEVSGIDMASFAFSLSYRF